MFSGTKLNVGCTCEGAWYMPNDRPVLLAQDELRQYLQIEPEKQINMVISLGFPKDKPKKLPRKEVDEITTFVLKFKIKGH